MSIIEKAAKRLAEKRRANRADSDDLLDLGAETVGQQAGADVLSRGSAARYEADLEARSVEPGQASEEETTGSPGPRRSGVPPSAGSAPGDAEAREAQSLLADVAGSPADETPEVWPEEADQDGLDAGIINVMRLDQALLLSPEGGKSRTAEEFRVIKRPLLVNAFAQKGSGDRHANLIMVTSAIQGEGKTFLSLNLAVSIAMEMDSTVLLVDADVAKPGLSKLLGVSQRPGLIEHLTDEHSELADLLMRTDIPKLTVLPAGERHKKSTELLASNNMQRLLNELASRYSDRIVLFDSPPLLESTEAAVLASQMGQVAMVVASQATSQVLVKEALSQFDSLDKVNLVLNKCKENIFSGKYGSYGYGYGYGYGYYGQKESEQS